MMMRLGAVWVGVMLLGSVGAAADEAPAKKTVPLARPPEVKTVVPATPKAVETKEGETYRHCLDLARKDPEQGFETASRWKAQGGGFPAEHCVALSLIGLKQPVEAAKRLDDLGKRMVSEAPALRAGMFAQAAEAWGEAGVPENAVGALTNAITVEPNNREHFVNRAVANAQRKNYQGAVDDLGRALSMGPPRADILAYRASALRYLKDLAHARLDADQAVTLNPKLAEAWLERANIERLSGDPAAARRDWLKVLELAPDSAAGDSARTNLATLDVRVDDVPTPKRR